MDDVRAVLDAVGSRQAALLGVSEGGPLCALYATTYPERTRALVMIGTYAKRRWAPDYPWAPTDEQGERFLEEIQRTWGGPVGLEARAPSVAARPGVPRLVEHLPAHGRQPRRGAGADADERRDRRARRAAGDPRADADPAPHRGSAADDRRGPLRRLADSRRHADRAARRGSPAVRRRPGHHARRDRALPRPRARRRRCRPRAGDHPHREDRRGRTPRHDRRSRPRRGPTSTASAAACWRSRRRRSRPPSTVRPGPSAAPRRWSRQARGRTARCGPACTPASASWSPARCAASPSASRATWRRWPGPARSSSAGRWSTSSPDRASSSSRAAPQPFGDNGDRFEIFAVRTPAA